jgi:signal transduction histidine kinase
MEVEYGRVLESNPELGQEILALSTAVQKAEQVAEGLRVTDRRRAFAQIGEMTAILAHEVRTPLARIEYGVHYLSDELNLEDEAAEHVRYVLESSRGINRLLGEVLQVFRPEQVRLVPCDLPSLLEGLLHYWRAQAETRGINVSTSYAQNLEPPTGDPSRLEQVFDNLISNALDAMREGDLLWIRAEPAHLLSTLTSQAPLPAVQVQVEDTGVGIPPDRLQRVFEPFYTTRQDRTGLGLAIAQRIVQDHRGSIEVQSEEMKGTVFTVTLPLNTVESDSGHWRGWDR